MSKKSNKYAGDPPKQELVGANPYLGLGRPIDLYDGVTRIAMLCTILSAVAVTIWKTMAGVGSYDAAMAGIGTALGFLFSFMIAQELDPDRKLGGIVGGGLTIIASLVLGEGNILVMLWLLFVLRMLNRTSGDRHRIVDNLIIIGSAVWLGTDGAWLYPLMTGAIYAVESQITGGYFRSLYLAGVAMAGAAVANYESAAPVLSVIYVYIMSFTFIIFLPEIRAAAFTQFKADKSGKRISPRRLQVAQGMFLFIGFFLPYFHGDDQALALLPAFMAAIGCGCYLFVDLLQKKIG